MNEYKSLFSSCSDLFFNRAHAHLNKRMSLLILQDILQQKVLIKTCLFSLKQDKGYRKTRLNSTALPPICFSIFPYQNFHLYFSNAKCKMSIQSLHVLATSCMTYVRISCML